MDKYGFFIIYLIAINLIGLAVMYQDKRRAILHRWRIPEKTLWLIALMMGSLGTTAGMWLFSHKSAKARFFIGFPLLCVVQIMILCAIIR